MLTSHHNPNEDYYRITHTAGPVDDFTYLVSFDDMPEALRAIAQEMEGGGLSIQLEACYADDLGGENGLNSDDAAHPVLKSFDEVVSFIRNYIANDTGEGPEDNIYTITLEDGHKYTHVHEPNHPNITPHLYWLWKHALSISGARPVAVSWPGSPENDPDE